MNYLDDFLFVAYTKALCIAMINQFLGVCNQVGVPIASEKTEWATPLLTFLEVLLNGFTMTLGIPEEKRHRVIFLLSKLIDKKKAMIRDLQKLCGFLNFLNRIVYPGRVFMQCMYAKYAHLNINYKDKPNYSKLVLTPYHHMRLDNEFKSDCKIWLKFF